MDDLTARLQALMRRYAAYCDQYPDDCVRLEEQLRQDLALLVAEYGRPAIDAALNGMSNDAWPSASLH
jgi:hypothetical protein